MNEVVAAEHIGDGCFMAVSRTRAVASLAGVVSIWTRPMCPAVVECDGIGVRAGDIGGVSWLACDGDRVLVVPSCLCCLLALAFCVGLLKRFDEVWHCFFHVWFFAPVADDLAEKSRFFQICQSGADSRLF
jgi:hypothetical protein